MGYPAQVSGVEGAKFVCHGIEGHPVHFLVVEEKSVEMWISLMILLVCTVQYPFLNAKKGCISCIGASESFRVGQGD